MDVPSYNKKQSHTVESMIQVASDYKADTNISFDRMHKKSMAKKSRLSEQNSYKIAMLKKTVHIKDLA